MESMEIDALAPSSVEKRETKPIVVLLMGVPGSGKSTFCDHVLKLSSRPWDRVCQDTINNGKAGTKPQCLSRASNALKEGKSVFIDRCNINREQRADFMKLGGADVEKHIVVLDHPAKLCISRSVKRTGHEGNLQGGRAAAVVNQMMQKKELPKQSEGFARITFCREEKDVQEAINVYSSLGPLDTLPSGIFGNKSTDTKTQVGIMRFLKKLDSSTTAKSEPPKLVPDKISPEKKLANQETKMDSDQSDDANKKLEGDKLEINSSSGVSALEKIPTLAFPSISTADFQFDIEKASDIIVEKVEEFASRIGKARLVLVDLSHGSKILSLVKAKAERKNIDPKKFFTFVGDITRLLSQRDLHCNIIANAANWRLKPGGGGVNAAIYKAAGSSLDIATKEKADCIKPGKSITVPLPSSSPLFTKEGVTHVIHVLGPNMNPNRPDCLKDDYVQGCKILRESYSSLFEAFLSVVKPDGVMSSTSTTDIQKVNPANEDQKVKRDLTHEPDKNKKFKGLQDENVGGETSKKWGTWAQALYTIARSPDKHKNVVLEVLDDVVVLNDAFPKAKQHILVLARVDGLDSIADVRKEHISLLRNMHDIGLKWAEKSLGENESLFRLGYHSVASMRQLHLHVISQDFDSKHLKNKKHWNSFNTPFFLDSVDVIKELGETGMVTFKDDKLLSMELRCHRCRSAHPNIPRLKSHISSCKAPFSAALTENGRLVSSLDINASANNPT